jgi:hypothetical protein
MEINLKLTISFLLPAAFMLLLAACGGGTQTADTPPPEAKAVVRWGYFLMPPGYIGKVWDGRGVLGRTKVT